jgi:hypothetical protein
MKSFDSANGTSQCDCDFRVVSNIVGHTTLESFVVLFRDGKSSTLLISMKDISTPELNKGTK